MAKTDIFAVLAARLKVTQKSWLEFVAAWGEKLPPTRADRRRITGRKAKAQLNPRQLWRRRRAKGRGTKGGARK